MNAPQFSRSPNTSNEMVRRAIRYWEPRRITFNLVLAAVMVAWLVLTWPHFRPAFTLQSLLAITALAAIANAFYCAAYHRHVHNVYTLGRCAGVLLDR